MNATAAPPRLIDWMELKVVTGKSRFFTTCHTPAASRSHNVNCLCSASNRNSDGTALVPLTTAAAPTMRESLSEPLI